MIDISLEDLRELVMDRKMEILLILHQESVKLWGEAHTKIAVCEAHKEKLKAEMQLMQAVIERESKKDQIAESIAAIEMPK